MAVETEEIMQCWSGRPEDPSLIPSVHGNMQVRYMPVILALGNRGGK